MPIKHLLELLDMVGEMGRPEHDGGKGMDKVYVVSLDELRESLGYMKTDGLLQSSSSL